MADRASGGNVRRAVLEQVFKVKNVKAMFSDAEHRYYASAAAATITPKRKGQIIIGNTGATWLAYVGKVGSDTASTATGTAAWNVLDIS